MNLPIRRSTSIAAWTNLLASDKMSKMYREVLRALYHNGPSTAKEIEFHSRKPGIWKRTSELRDTGYIIEVQKRQCSITKEDVIEWSIPDVPPESIETLRMFYRVSCYVGHKNHSWVNLTRYIAMRRCVSLEAKLAKAFKAAFSSVEFAKIQKWDSITEADYTLILKSEAHMIIRPVQEVE